MQLVNFYSDRNRVRTPTLISAGVLTLRPGKLLTACTSLDCIAMQQKLYRIIPDYQDYSGMLTCIGVSGRTTILYQNNLCYIHLKY